MNLPTIGIVGFGTYFPNTVENAAEFAARSGIPESILREKMGIRQRHIAGLEDTVTHMASEAAMQSDCDGGHPTRANQPRHLTRQ